MLLEAKQIQLSYGDRCILDIDQFSIYKGDKIGLVGDNGAGKSTLLHILSGELKPDAGNMDIRCNISYFKQFDKREEAEGFVKEYKEFNVDKKIQQDHVSGGEHTRILLSEALSKESHILFADEPTTNLDIEGIQLVKEKLKKQDTMILVSHDRSLLDEVCNKIVEIHDAKLEQYNGNYSLYEEVKKQKKERELAEYNEYVSEKQRLMQVHDTKMKEASKVGKKSRKLSSSEAKMRDFMSTHRSNDGRQRSLHSRANDALKKINQLEVKEKPKEAMMIRPDFALTNPPESKIIIKGEKVSFSYGTREIFDRAYFSVKNKKRVAIIGENGIGKTTLLKLLGSSYNGITVNEKVKFGYFYQEFENLEYEKTVLENVMSVSVQKESVARAVLARLLFQENDVKKSAGVLSGGERNKLSFAKLFVSDANVLLLDEPTNFLDIRSIKAFEELFSAYEGSMLFVSHDMAFINAVADELLIIKDHKIQCFEGTYQAYQQEMKRSKKSDNRGAMLMAAEIRKTKILSRFSDNREDKEKLEDEYQQVLEEIQKLKSE